MAELWETWLVTKLFASAPFHATPHMFSQLQLIRITCKPAVHRSPSGLCLFGCFCQDCPSALDHSFSTRWNSTPPATPDQILTEAIHATLLLQLFRKVNFTYLLSLVVGYSFFQCSTYPLIVYLVACESVLLSGIENLFKVETLSLLSLHRRVNYSVQHIVCVYEIFVKGQTRFLS